MPSAASHASRLAREAERIVLVLASSSYDLSNLKGIENVSILKSSVPTAASAYVYPALALLAKRVGKLYAATVSCDKDVNEALHEAHALGITLLVLAPRHANSTANGEDTHDIVTWVDGGANSSTAQLVLAAVALGYKSTFRCGPAAQSRFCVVAQRKKVPSAPPVLVAVVRAPAPSGRSTSSVLRRSAASPPSSLSAAAATVRSSPLRRARPRAAGALRMQRRLRRRRVCARARKHSRRAFLARAQRGAGCATDVIRC